ncbi:hypothetical protein HAX54_033630 [Datura stramonium]|uniref:Uncharacterized protein n=1 Tax=Datura stramonium TaxID=4076 RepID=A0ABS8VDR7_DATST|nr:hypothetical protein [Datura stramonium]
MVWNLRFSPKKFHLEHPLRDAVLTTPSLLRITELTALPRLHVVPLDTVSHLCVAEDRATLVPAPRARPCAARPARCYLCLSSSFAPHFQCSCSSFVENHGISPAHSNKHMKIKNLSWVASQVVPDLMSHHDAGKQAPHASYRTVVPVHHVAVVILISGNKDKDIHDASLCPRNSSIQVVAPDEADRLFVESDIVKQLDSLNQPPIIPPTPWRPNFGVIYIDALTFTSTEADLFWSYTLDESVATPQEYHKSFLVGTYPTLVWHLTPKFFITLVVPEKSRLPSKLVGVANYLNPLITTKD